MAYWKCLGILEMMKISLTEFNYGEKCYWESFQYKARQFVGCLWRIEWGILIIDIENFTHGANSIFSFTINPPKTGCMPFFYRFIKSNRKINDNRTTKHEFMQTILFSIVLAFFKRSFCTIVLHQIFCPIK